MKTIKKLTLVALATMISSATLPVGTGYKGAASNPNGYDVTSDVFIRPEGTIVNDNSSVKDNDDMIAPAQNDQPRMGQDGHGILNPNYKQYKDAKHALRRIHTYRISIARRKNNGTLSPNYTQYRKDMMMVQDYLNSTTSTAIEMPSSNTNETLP